jgi:hypothetical protein
MIYEKSFKVYHKQNTYQHAYISFLLGLRQVCVKHNIFHLWIIIYIDLHVNKASQTRWPCQ